MKCILWRKLWPTTGKARNTEPRLKPISILGTTHRAVRMATQGPNAGNKHSGNKG